MGETEIEFAPSTPPPPRIYSPIRSKRAETTLTLLLLSGLHSQLSFSLAQLQTAVGLRTPSFPDCKAIAAPIRWRQRFANCPSIPH